jgi:hypothetical protein
MCNIRRLSKLTLHQLDLLQQAIHCPFASDKESSLKLTLDQLLKHEETLWRSKFRETWLTCKDLNTKYFHTSTLIRRRSNDINFLKLDFGAWISSRAEIGRQFSDYFSKLFTTSNPIVEDEMLNLFSGVVSEEDNSHLCSIPTEVEVIQALASLGFSKASGPDGFIALFYKKY